MEKSKKKTRKWTNEEKGQMAQMMFNLAEEELENHMDRMVERAKELVQDLEKQRKYFNEKKNETDRQMMNRAGQFESSLRTVQDCFNNYDTSDAARRLAKYEKAKSLLAVFKGKEVRLW